MTRTLVLTNATGRQSASLARAASAVGFALRAHVAAASHSPLVASELAALPHTTVLTGELSSADFLAELFDGADLAYVNTTAFDDEEAVGRACADLAAELALDHLVYSSMPDHAAGDGDGARGWYGLPQWRDKWKVEAYMRELLGPRATFVYTGIYHNNFTSLPYPLFSMREVQQQQAQRQGGRGGGPHDRTDEGPPSSSSSPSSSPSQARKAIGFEWCAPFPADVKLPWLDCEHDLGPAVLQIFKSGPTAWGGRRVPLAFSFLTPVEVCAAFSRALQCPARYVQGPITYSVPVPAGYREQLQALERLLGGAAVDGLAAPYWWEGLMELERESEKETERQAILRTARGLWPGWRGMEEYAHEVFPVEEKLNGRTWMDDDDSLGSGSGDSSGSGSGVGDGDGDGDGDDNNNNNTTTNWELELDEARPL